MATLVITAVIPRIIRILRMLLPTILPIVIPALLLSAAVMLTAASGILVPIATIVSPITSCGIPSFFAIPAAPSTNQSAPLTRNKNPTNKINTCKTIRYLFFLRHLINMLILMCCSSMSYMSQSLYIQIM